MQEDLKEEVERNLRQSKVALQEYEDQVRKLECQKQLLLKQVKVNICLVEVPITLLTLRQHLWLPSCILQVLQLEVQLSEVSTKAESSSRQLQEANALISVLQTESKGLQLDLSKVDFWILCAMPPKASCWALGAGTSMGNEWLYQMTDFFLSRLKRTFLMRVWHRLARSWRKCHHQLPQ